MAKAITVIPATKNIFTAAPTNSIAKRKVAAYARVSTDSDEQYTSYEAQIDYYTQFIHQRSDWDFAGVYTDEGISGTNTKHRDGFNQMIADALDGKIDLIVTKSVSRFARNTVDSLVTVRKLKEHGTEVYFEKENIYTFDSKGELLITIMSSLAQEESRSISKNVTWGQRKRFADGKVSMPYKHFLGYEKGEHGQPVINPEEAEIVRLIYRLYLRGKTPGGICKELERLEIRTPANKTSWRSSTINSILQNEKYKGDALLQKTFTVDFLSKKLKQNQGEVPQYYVENSHEAVITPLEFDMVQVEIARRKKLGRSYSGVSIFSSKIICGDCGAFYGRKTWHSGAPWQRILWHCNRKFKGERQCATPSLEVPNIQRLFMVAYNQLMGNRDALLQDCEEVYKLVADCSQLDEEIALLTDEVHVVTELVSQCIAENATTGQPQEAYIKKYTALVERYEQANNKLTAITTERTERQCRGRELRIFITELQEKPLVLEEWNEELWVTILEHATVYADESVGFQFKNGTVIKVEAE